MKNADPFKDVLVIDHLQAIQDKDYAATVAAKIKELTSSPGFKPIQALHEADDSCCRIQPWPVTSSHLMADSVAAATGQDPGDIQAQLAEHEPSVLLVADDDR